MQVSGKEKHRVLTDDPQKDELHSVPEEHLASCCGNSKLIPLMISRCIQEKEMPFYGDGQQIREWIHVCDHCEAIDAVFNKGLDGEVYNIGGNNEMTNLEIVRRIIRIMGKPQSLIRHVTDRPGHDRRYRLDSTKIAARLGWSPRDSFEKGLVETIQWYQANQERLVGTLA